MINADECLKLCIHSSCYVDKIFYRKNFVSKPLKVQLKRKQKIKFTIKVNPSFLHNKSDDDWKHWKCNYLVCLKLFCWREKILCLFRFHHENNAKKSVICCCQSIVFSFRFSNRGKVVFYLGKKIIYLCLVHLQKTQTKIKYFRNFFPFHFLSIYNC